MRKIKRVRKIDGIGDDPVLSLRVVTFGEFDIRRADTSLIKKSKRSQRYIELLEYFLTNRGKKLSAEHIINNLWGDRESADPQNVLRTQIFRIRKLLREAKLYGDEALPGETLEILLENGFYRVDVGENCVIDAELFEQGIKEGDQKIDSDPNDALEQYTNAFTLYQGEYLEGNSDSEWVYINRNRYNRLFVHATLRMFELLKRGGLWRDIVLYFDRAVLFDPLEEALHLFYLEALLSLGEYKNALSHYNYITSRIDRELGVKPTSAFRNIYGQIIAGEKNAIQADIYGLRREFSREDKKSGALFCDPEYFKTIYNLEERKSLRGESDTFVGLLTLASSLPSVPPELYDAAFEKLKPLLSGSLRKGDVFTQWNRRQLIVLLMNAQKDSLERICRRIRKRFLEDCAQSGIELYFSFEPISEKVSGLE